MAFTPSILNPEPDPFYTRELRKIDPDLRIVWGYERYLVKEWAIERKIPPERYWPMYASVTENDAPRFIDQPIFDDDQPIYNDEGDLVGYKQVGTRRYDLAPEYEWMMFTKHLDMKMVTELKRAYAWDQNHSLTRLKMEKEAEHKAKEEAENKELADRIVDELPRVFRETGLHLFGEQPKKVMEGTEL